MTRFAEGRGIEFALLADPDSKIISAFGLRNERFGPGSYGYGLAHPALIVIDADGIVRRRHSGPSYRSRPEPDEILATLQ